MEIQWPFLIPDALEAELLCGCMELINSVPNSHTGDSTPREVHTGVRPVAHSIALGQPGIWHDVRKRTTASIGVVVGFENTGRILKVRVYFGVTGKVLIRGHKFTAIEDVPADWHWIHRRIPQPLVFSNAEARLLADSELVPDPSTSMIPKVNQRPTVSQPVIQPQLSPEELARLHRDLLYQKEINDKVLKNCIFEEFIQDSDLQKFSS
jgi:hypothetical protein